VDTVLRRLGGTPDRLSSAEAEARRAALGPNAVRSHHAQPLAVLVRQLRTPLFHRMALAPAGDVDLQTIGITLAAAVALCVAATIVFARRDVETS